MALLAALLAPFPGSRLDRAREQPHGGEAAEELAEYLAAIRAVRRPMNESGEAVVMHSVLSCRSGRFRRRAADIQSGRLQRMNAERVWEYPRLGRRAKHSARSTGNGLCVYDEH
jgi:hypothetical protein